MAQIDTTLTDVFKSTPLGDVKSAIGTVLYGINHRQTPNPVPINQDGYGLTLMTRPQLNLSTGNIRAMRQFIPLLTQNEVSLPRMIRGYLDPRLDLPCPIMDQKSAFIPLLTNHMLSCSGWPDPYVDVHTSKPGVYRESFSMVDSMIDIYNTFDITATFRNMVGDPITSMMFYWIHYMSAVFRGDMVPYPDFIAFNEIDYNTRIYRLVLDRSKRFVQKIACTGASFPKNNQLGAAFNFETSTPLNHSNDQLSVTFQCNGACYQDPIIVHEFNSVVKIFNPQMQTRAGMQLLQPNELQFFNNRGYPRIDPDSMELQWWVDSSEYSAQIAGYARNANALNSPNANASLGAIGSISSLADAVDEYID